MDNSVRAAFDLTAQAYDRARRQLVPCFDDFYRAAIELIPFARDAPIAVLDLGAGTGLLSAFVTQRFASARIRLVDVAPEMLTRARERFKTAADRVRFAVSDYAREAIEGRYDAVVSALSIHHIPDADKRALFTKIHTALSSGGIFINAEQVMGPTVQAERRNREQWLRQVRERGVSEEDLALALERMKHDRMATLEDQMRWLSETGFSDVDCVYKSRNVRGLLRLEVTNCGRTMTFMGIAGLYKAISSTVRCIGQFNVKRRPGARHGQSIDRHTAAVRSVSSDD